MEEIFKTIDGFDNYEISNIGNVRNKKTGRILKPSISKGYYCVNLWRNKIKFIQRNHKLVANAFIENQDNKPLTDHFDNNTLNNNVNNLRWCSNQENMRNKKIPKNNKSGIKGVCYSEKLNKWNAYIKIDKKTINLGYFNSLEEAGNVRREKATELFGEFLNDCEK